MSVLLRAKIFILLFVVTSCAQVTSINLKKHQFGRVPTKIVWIQVAGLETEHISLLKFDYPSSTQLSALEKFTCVGQAWEYNLFKLRPSAKSSFLSQLTGKKNIKNTCDDYQLKPVWAYLNPNGYKSGILEDQTKSGQSLTDSKSCNENFLTGTTVWKMQQTKDKEANYFHSDFNKDFEPNNIYYDRSCQTGRCYSSFSQNAISVYKSFSRNSENFLYVLRNFSYSSALEKGDMRKVKEELSQIDKTVAYFQEIAARKDDFLLILSGAKAKRLSFPKSGRQWERFEKSKRYKIEGNPNLVSAVFASGARAENFCGIYEQSDIFNRIFSDAKQQGLEFTIINPFD